MRHPLPSGSIRRKSDVEHPADQASLDGACRRDRPDHGHGSRRDTAGIQTSVLKLSARCTRSEAGFAFNGRVMSLRSIFLTRTLVLLSIVLDFRAAAIMSCCCECRRSAPGCTRSPFFGMWATSSTDQWQSDYSLRSTRDGLSPRRRARASWISSLAICSLIRKS